MEYRKYKAPTLKEAKLKMLLDIGKRGYIIKQKTIKEGGLFGIFGKPMVEITVSVLSDDIKSEKIRSNYDDMDNDNFYMSNRGNNNRNNNYYNNDVQTYQDANMYKQSLERIKEIGMNISKSGNNTGTMVSDSVQHNQKNNTEEDLREEITELKKMLTEVKSQNTIQNKDTKKPDNKSEQDSNLIKILKEYDFSDKVIDNYIDTEKYSDLVSKDDKELIRKIVMDMIGDSIQLTDGVSLNENESKSIVLVGPTGVGKTTTLAKLGAYYGIIQDKRVKFISMDNYRVGAVQQLKIYSEIMEIPFAKVNTKEELVSELDYDNFDIILVDTAGRSQNADDDINEIKEYIDELSGNVCVCLVVSSTTKYKDLLKILDKFSILNYSNIIATKIDETSSFGQILSALMERNLKLSYISFGQSVPEHLKSATKINLIETLFNY